MKSRNFFIGFMILYLFMNVITSNVKGENYSLGVREGDEYIWVITVVDDDTFYKDIHEDFRLKVGDYSKIVITDIEEYSDVWIVKFDYWYWGSSLQAEPTYRDLIDIIPKDPEPIIKDSKEIARPPIPLPLVGGAIYKSSLFAYELMPICPLEVENYLRQRYTSNILSRYVTLEFFDRYSVGGFDMSYTYDLETGVLYNFKMQITFDDRPNDFWLGWYSEGVVFQFNLVNPSNNVIISNSVAILSIAATCVVYIFMRKK